MVIFLEITIYSKEVISLVIEVSGKSFSVVDEGWNLQKHKLHFYELWTSIWIISGSYS